MMVAFEYDTGAVGSLYYSREIPSLLLGLQQASGPPSFFVLPELELARDTTNVVAADFNSDGRVDLLLPRENFSEPGFAVRLRQP